ncbi:MAG: DUF2490 domain-containing protein [Saprospiraceae bacterium]|nr:DUF2490 domain-containing protein [Saprospiraceae bacterium]MDW8228480.1 DUF2490 domain-containing protein [Saprospiraceae bacterium]
MIRPRSILLIFFTAGLPLSWAFSQSPRTIDRHGVSWNRYYLTWSFRPNWTFHQEVDYRFLIKTGAWHQLALHTHVHYRPHTNAEFALGATRMENGDPVPSKTPYPHRVEWRAFQELHFWTPLVKPFTLHHRYRIEQRFLSGTKAPFVWRGRYRVQFNWTLPAPKWTVHVANEAFLNWGRGVPTVFDQNRTYVGLSCAFSTHLRVEVGYMMQWQQAGRPDLLYQRDIGRVSVFHQL